MIRRPGIWCAALAAAGVLIGSPRAAAGWITIVNDTDQTLVVQEAPADGPVFRPFRGRLVRLLPGEVYREYQPTPGTKRVHIFDPKSPQKPVCQETLSWRGDDLSLKLSTEGPVVRLLHAITAKATALVKPSSPPAPPVPPPPSVQTATPQPPK